MSNAQSQFICHIERSKDLLIDLEEQLDAFLRAYPATINWEHVGDVKHIELTLEALLKHSRREA